MTTTRQQAFQDAQGALLAEYGVVAEDRRIRIADPPLSVHVLAAGAGEPVLLVHGSGMSAATWTPLLAQLRSRRAVAVDLPCFGLSDPHDYRGRSLRRHAVAQLSSILDALGLQRVPIVGTSLGAMWGLCLALDEPQRVSAVVGLGVPAVALAGMRSDPFFRAMTLPWLGKLVARIPPPPTTATTRRAMAKVLGRGALDRTPDAFFEVVRAGMRMPGWRQAMWTHLNLALRAGRQRPENILADDELRQIAAPILLIWGADDIYGAPQIADRALKLIPNARIAVLPGGHAPFLTDPERCATLIENNT
jgi:pimeloyl-ACP methyl ester carboxylesterase